MKRILLGLLVAVALAAAAPTARAHEITPENGDICIDHGFSLGSLTDGILSRLNCHLEWICLPLGDQITVLDGIDLPRITHLGRVCIPVIVCNRSCPPTPCRPCPPPPVPEPGSFALAGMGLVALVGVARRKLLGRT